MTRSVRIAASRAAKSVVEVSESNNELAMAPP